MKYFLQRILWLLFAIFIALTINFMLPRLMPGDPATILIQRLEGLEPAAINAVRNAFGLETDKHIIIQYKDYLIDLLLPVNYQWELGRRNSHKQLIESTVLLVHRLIVNQVGSYLADNLLNFGLTYLLYHLKC